MHKKKTGEIELSEFRVQKSKSLGAKVVWRDSDGNKYGIRMSLEDYEALNTEEGAVIREITL